MYLFIFFFLLSLCSISQNGYFFEAEYDIYYNTAVPNTKKSTLQVDLSKQKSIYYIFKGTLKNGIKRGENNTIAITEKGEDRYVSLDLKSNILISKELIKGKPIFIKEELPTLNWVLDPAETKMIGKLQCAKATVTFRGRDYIAWYSKDIPINYGPYKFHGLPGLIIEIYDTSRRYTWSLKSYKTLNNVENLFALDPVKDYSTLYEFVQLRYGNTKKVSKARVPRGVQTQYLKIARNGIEIAFDWEN